MIHPLASCVDEFAALNASAFVLLNGAVLINHEDAVTLPSKEQFQAHE
jgi:hypothetical protein